MDSPTPQQQAALQQAYRKLTKDLHRVKQTFIERSLPVIEQLDEKTQQAIRDHIKNTST